MNSSNQTALDLDGVIFDYEKTFLKQAARLNLNISIKHPEIYNMTERYEITQEQLSLINLNIDYSDMDIFDEVLNLKRYIINIKCFITSFPEEILHLRKSNLSKIFNKDIPVYYAGVQEKHRIISELGIKYFIDDYDAVIHHIELNCPDCKAYWLNRGYKDKTLPEPVNKINNLTEFFKINY
ncbi:MAG: hypothetical protein EVJ46_09650 [Candidatus Acididesulfobacter guangdongensis]|uniref:Haloacid dehalogenase n=1 Tax=Acididesulfobacter guangdongensis TaxID=2597225 RepID=A0A519BET5_ACIG2|nr:MAG: hypothetical protein EVJ46_09650 [Candidatus Acididesulfobacter guangdongensis]